MTWLGSGGQRVKVIPWFKYMVVKASSMSTPGTVKSVCRMFAVDLFGFVDLLSFQCYCWCRLTLLGLLLQCLFLSSLLFHVWSHIKPLLMSAKTTRLMNHLNSPSLSYLRRTARRATLADLCHVSRGMRVRKVSNSKWPSSHSIGPRTIS